MTDKTPDAPEGFAVVTELVTLRYVIAAFAVGIVIAVVVAVILGREGSDAATE